jgi:hypothetical protein
VDEKGNLTRFASREGLPSRGLSRTMREILSLKLPLVRSLLMKIKKAGQERPALFYFGGREGDRTLGLRIANAALSQLSYSPTVLKRRGSGYNLIYQPKEIKGKIQISNRETEPRGNCIEGKPPSEALRLSATPPVPEGCRSTGVESSPAGAGGFQAAGLTNRSISAIVCRLVPTNRKPGRRHLLKGEPSNA